MKPSYLSRKHLQTELGLAEMKTIKASVSRNILKFDEQEESKKRVYFKDLEHRNLNALFNSGRERIWTPMYGIGVFGQLRFK